MAELTQLQADAVLQRALELSDEARERFLDESCGTDGAMRALIERLLRAGESDDAPLTPGGGASGPLWEELTRQLSATMSLEPGSRLGAYRIVRTLGRGGMATVYLARRADGQFEHTVALKVLDATRNFEELAIRFAQERQILATLNHPNIARLIDGGVTPAGQSYVVMEYVDGEPVDAYCDRSRLTIAKRIALFGQVAAAVHYAHGHLIVHRDIKPSNILVTAEGQPKLLDFGIAKLLDPSAPHAAPETRNALHLMTPEYASPEQVRGEPLTTASDVYQLGYLLYQLLTGRAPYGATGGRNFAEVVRVICSAEAVRPSQTVMSSQRDASSADVPAVETISAVRSTTPQRLRRELSGDLDRITLMALRKEPEQRYTSVYQLGDDLRRHAEGLTVTARPPTLRYRTAKFLRRHRVGAAAAALIVLTLVAGLAATAWQARVAAREARRTAEVRDFLIGLFESAEPDATLGQKVTAKELIDRGAARLESSLAGEPALRAEMLGVVGRIYKELGLYADSRPLLEEALAQRRGLGPSGAEDIAGSASDLALVLYEQGEYDAAQQLAREAVAIRRMDARAAPADLAASLAILASILSRRGEAAEAETLYREAIEIDRGLGDRAQLALHLSGFGVALDRTTAYEQAQRMYEEALSLQRELYGAEHTRIATTLLNLAVARMERGDFPKAEELALESLAMRRKLLGSEHPHVAVALTDLGNLLGRAGRLDDAEDAHRQALAIRRAVLGEAHPDVANSLNSIGVSLYFKGRYSDAADMFERVLPIWRLSYGPHHQDVLSVMNNLGAAWREAGNYEAAERVLRETLALRREAFGDTHRYVAQSFNNLALVLAKSGADVEAEKSFRQAVSIWRQTMGDDHPDVGDGLVELGKFLLNRRRFAEAEPVLRESLEIRTRSLDPQAPLLASTRQYLGECLLRLDRLEEADELLAASVPVLIARWGEDAEVTRRAKRAHSEVRAKRSAGGGS